MDTVSNGIWWRIGITSVAVTAGMLLYLEMYWDQVFNYMEWEYNYESGPEEPVYHANDNTDCRAVVQDLYEKADYVWSMAQENSQHLLGYYNAVLELQEAHEFELVDNSQFQDWVFHDWSTEDGDKPDFTDYFNEYFVTADGATPVYLRDIDQVSEAMDALYKYRTEVGLESGWTTEADLGFLEDQDYSECSNNTQELVEIYLKFINEDGTDHTFEDQESMLESLTNWMDVFYS